MARCDRNSMILRTGPGFGTRNREYQLMSGRKLLEAILFLLLSIGAFCGREINLFLLAPESFRHILGYPPSPALVDIALAVYCFSATVLILTGLASGNRPDPGWKHLGYRSAFFGFYCFSGSIATHFTAVVVVGLFLYLLEQAQIWFYCWQAAHIDDVGGQP